MPFSVFLFSFLLPLEARLAQSGARLVVEKDKKEEEEEEEDTAKNTKFEKFVDWFAGSRNAVKLAASGGNPAAAVAASAHPPVLWSSRRKPGKSFHPFDTCSRRFSANVERTRRRGTRLFDDWTGARPREIQGRTKAD